MSVKNFSEFCEEHAMPFPESIETLLERPKILVIEDDLEMLKSIGRIIRQSTLAHSVSRRCRYHHPKTL